MNVVLAIDPGRSKCGLAVVRRMAGGPFEVLHRGVIETSELAATLADLSARFGPDVIVVGDGTNSPSVAHVAEELEAAPVLMVDEKFTTILARKRYFKENPPKGLRRLIPTSLQTPPRPCDDYVAVILAENYLSF
ncbi:MAG: Holliday junction resolvase RuvX [Armatimonadetes bacterium]|nr:Holliday junction resolvase RuvX [Armatimonadota bacterium]